METLNKYYLSGYQKYFALSIFQRINARQHRNSLNINSLFSATITANYSLTDKAITFPKVNNGLYHHTGKSHSKYPKY